MLTQRQIGEDWLPARLDVPVACLIALATTFMFTLQHWGDWAVDFAALYMAGFFFAAGDLTQIYAAPPEVISTTMPEVWTALLTEIGHGDKQTYAFIYPPWVAALVAPVTVLDPQSAMNALAALNAALLLGSAALAWRVMGRPLPLWLWMAISAGMLVTGLPAQSAMTLGQAQILVTFLTLLSFERLTQGREIQAGAALALAAALKLTPAAFVLVFVAGRNRTAFKSFCATGAALAAISLTLFGWDPHAIYLDRLATINDQLIIAFFAFSVENFLYETWAALTGIAPLHTEIEYHFAKPGWVGLTAKAGFLAAVITLWFQTAWLSPDRRRITLILGLALAIPLFGPLGWAHYYLVALALVPGLYALVPARTATLMLALLTFTLSVGLQLTLNAPPRTVFPQITLMVPIFAALLALVTIARPARTDVKSEDAPEPATDALHPARARL